MIYIRTDSKYGDLEYRNSDYAIMKKKKKLKFEENIFILCYRIMGRNRFVLVVDPL